MKTSVIVSILLLLIVNCAYAREKRLIYKKESRLTEILASGGYLYSRDKKGKEYFCFGELNFMSFNENTYCKLVKGKIDHKNGELIEIKYILDSSDSTNK